LVDRAKDSLALVRQLPQEPDDVPCALTIQSRGRFVQEQQQFGLGGELDTDRKTLAGFDVQRHDDRISKGLKFQEFDDFLDICVLLFLRDVVRLPQVSRKPHGLTDSSRALVYIHLFGVGSATSEVAAEGPSVDEKITGDDTDILPLGEDIEASGLSCTGSTHEGGHGTGLDVAVDIVEESERSTGDGDSVIDTFPSEGLVVSEGKLLSGLGPLLFDGLGSLLLLVEGSVEFCGLGGLLGEDSEAKTIKRRTLKTLL